MQLGSGEWGKQKTAAWETVSSSHFGNIHSREATRETGKLLCFIVRKEKEPDTVRKCESEGRSSFDYGIGIRTDIGKNNYRK